VLKTRCRWQLELKDIGNGLLYCPEHLDKVNGLREWLGSRHAEETIWRFLKSGGPAS
jgi:hypothetical protein